MVAGSAHRERRDPIFPRNPTHIRPKTPLQLQREFVMAFLCRENTVKQCGAKGMRHREDPPSEYHTAPTGRCSSPRPNPRVSPWAILMPSLREAWAACLTGPQYHAAPTGRCSSPRPNPRVSPWAILMPSLREAWAACLTGPQYHTAPTGRCSSPRPNPRVSPWAILMPSLREAWAACLTGPQYHAAPTGRCNSLRA